MPANTTLSPESLSPMIPLSRVGHIVDQFAPRGDGRTRAMGTAYGWVARGQLRTKTIGGLKYVAKADLLAFLGIADEPKAPTPAPSPTKRTRARELQDVEERLAARGI